MAAEAVSWTAAVIKPCGRIKDTLVNILLYIVNYCGIVYQPAPSPAYDGIFEALQSE
jgi:hypothetical protein